MLGQPVSMLIPQVVGFRLTGELPEGATATDLVLTVTQMLRERGVVSKFVEFYGPGLREPAAGRPRDDRQHVAGVRRDVRHLPGRRRDAALPRVHRPPAPSRSSWSRPTAARRGCSTSRSCRGAGVLRHARARPRRRRAEPGRAAPPAGPRRAQPTRRATSARSCAAFVSGEAYQGWDTSRRPDVPGERPAVEQGRGLSPKPMPRRTAATARPRQRGEGLDHGAVVIAAITSCTNTSNPSVMLGAGLLAQARRSRPA